MEIRYLKHNEIDKVKWDKCIDNAPNGLVYALSWYLDIVNPGWEALVEGDYISVMPLPVKKKFGISYLIQPFLAQQGGVFSKTGTSMQIINSFLTNLPAKFKYVSIALNSSNVIDNSAFDIIIRHNHILDLSYDYDKLYNNYARRAKRNLKKAKEYNLTLFENMPVDDFIKFKIQYNTAAWKPFYINIITNLLHHLHKFGYGHILATKNSFGEITSAAYYFLWKKKLYFLITVSSEQGKDESAMFFILDKIIKTYSGQCYTMDFTGSSLKDIAYFNEGFGAQPTNYYHIKKSSFPWLFKLFKK